MNDAHDFYLSLDELEEDLFMGEGIENHFCVWGVEIMRTQCGSCRQKRQDPQETGCAHAIGGVALGRVGSTRLHP